MSFYIHPTAEVSNKSTIGYNTRIWHQAQVREGAKIGNECIIGKGAYVDFDVIIGDHCKLQNGVYVYHGAVLANGVFLGPGAMILNDKKPRAINPDGTLKTSTDWEVGPVHVGQGAGIGGGAMVLPGVTIGKWAMVGTGAVVTRDVPDYGLCLGNPARLVGFVCACGHRLAFKSEAEEGVILACSTCSEEVVIPRETYRQLRQL
jgi:UDP-2-acetamido-3-amino-2,3-dideoxy-glucuronate N-acetyltransferase